VVDLVLLVNGVTYLQHPWKFLKKFGRLLVEGGIFVLIQGEGGLPGSWVKAFAHLYDVTARIALVQRMLAVTPGFKDIRHVIDEVQGIFSVPKR